MATAFQRAWGFAALLGTCLLSPALSADTVERAPTAAPIEPILLEFHFKPVAGLQIAIWLEDAAGNFIQDVFVTQATGKLGIANRAGLWDFVSSWRAPYGPRPMVLPIWAHRRGKTYPKIVFYDADPGDQESLGWHESTSSPESYYCRPLTASEHEVISTDTMTCPSPSKFETDKGRFDGNESSVYPPRNDLVSFEQDSADAMEYSLLNDLDAVTGATPMGDKPTFETAVMSSPPSGKVVAWIEVSLERDENASYSFEREDHYIDPRLPTYGIEFFGQPSVVYRVEFDPNVKAFTGTSQYAGYGEWDGSTGLLYPPDASISTASGSGADRLRQYTLNGKTFRFGVFSHGGSGGGDDGGDGSDGGESGTSGHDSGGEDGSGTSGGDDGGWGSCTIRELPPMMGLDLQAVAFDTVEVGFDVPILDGSSTPVRASVFYLKTRMPLNAENLGQAVEAMCDAELVPGSRASCRINELHGDATYQFAVRYKDGCSNVSDIVTGEVQTLRQKFAQVESFCFVATAAYGGAWLAEVDALRSFRDTWMRPTGVGLAFVRFYYAHSPLFARWIEGSPVARTATRIVLQPFADLAKLTRLRSPLRP